MPMQDRVTFAELCRLLTSLKQKKGDAKVELLRSFFATWRREGSPDPEVTLTFSLFFLVKARLQRNIYSLADSLPFSLSLSLVLCVSLCVCVFSLCLRLCVSLLSVSRTVWLVVGKDHRCLPCTVSALVRLLVACPLVLSSCSLLDLKCANVRSVVNVSVLFF